MSDREIPKNVEPVSIVNDIIRLVVHYIHGYHGNIVVK